MQLSEEELALSVSDLWLAGVKVQHEPACAPQPLDPPLKCALVSCPHLIREGYPLHAILKETNVYAFNYLGGGLDGYLCRSCALLHLNDMFLGGGIAVEGGTVFFVQKRRWKEALAWAFTHHAGKRAALLFTNDVRGRYWPYVPLTRIAPVFDMYLRMTRRVDKFFSFEGTVRCEYTTLMTLLELFEALLAMGLNRHDLLALKNPLAYEKKWTLSQLKLWAALCSDYRQVWNLNEFIPAIFMAMGPKKEEEDESRSDPAELDADQP